MIKDQIQVSATFKKQADEAIYAIVLFVISYFLLFLLATGLTMGCAYAGFKLILGRPSFISLIAGVGLALFGFLILFFLIKFIFKSNKIDYNMLVEIQREQQPQLFQMLDEIVASVGTDFPKKVFLSAEVNASVFYDSNFWSMFFPVRKNLVIGMGLVNSITNNELKAILSHEFGHFSQKSMKVGSYVYNVNHVIYNMLYDNESFEKLMDRLSATSGIFSIFIYLAGAVLRGIQWLLQKLYTVVNITYMGLSREMEFHADEIAAQITGYIPLKESLLRMSLAEHAYHSVLGFYENRISENVQSMNIYPEQYFVMNYLAKDSELEIESGMPKVTFSELNKFNKSKLVIKDQWASHPGIDERIAYLETVAEAKKEAQAAPAITIFQNAEQLCKKLTEILFSTVTYEGEIKKMKEAEFKQLITEDFENNSFDKIYNSYYDQGNPMPFDVDEAVKTNGGEYRIEDLYSDAMVELKFTAISLRSDLETLDMVANPESRIKTFDYDGQKFHRKDGKELKHKLSATLEDVNEKLRDNDKNILRFFMKKSTAIQEPEVLLEKYRTLFELDKGWDDKLKIYDEISQDLEFTARVTPFKQIIKNFEKIKEKEDRLKSRLNELLTAKEEAFKKAISKDDRETLEKYLEKDWVYFKGENYNDTNLNLLYTALNAYPAIMSKLFFNLKKSLLDYQVALLK